MAFDPKYGCVRGGPDSIDDDTPNGLFVLHYAPNTTRVNGASFRLQNGPIREVGVNGCQIDEVIRFAQDRLREFNKLAPSRQTQEAITHLGQALLSLAIRTADRESRGVEGTKEV